MKNSNNNRRQRSRGNGRRYPNQRGNSFESSGPEAKVRGSAQQVLDKYQSLARDAFSAGDRILAEGYLQHAEHYYRILNTDNANGGRDNNRGQQGRNNNGADQGENQKPSEETASSENSDAPAQATEDAGQSASEDTSDEPKRKPRQRRPKKEVPIEAAETDAPAEQPSAGD